MDGVQPGQTGMSDDEAVLLARMQSGDDDAFEACVRTFCSRLLLVARRILRNEEDANDAVQDTFLSAFKGISQFKGQSRLGTWLHRIVVNTAFERLRAKSRRPEVLVDELPPMFDREGAITGPVPAIPEGLDASLERDELRALVRECIAQLPASLRSVVLLRDMEDLTTLETAEQLGISEGAVKVRLHRGRHALTALISARLAERTH